ncbi:MAG: hypothetical protein ACI4EU_03005 [Butyrivibrio sp.]
MLTANINKQKMHYALFDKTVPIYTEYVNDDGTVTKLDTGETKTVYSEPKEFYGNIAMSGGEAQNAEYGLDMSQYSAILITCRKELPLTETSLIWFESEPETGNDGCAVPQSADYRIVKINRSLNFDKYILQKVIKGEKNA